jgi:CRISPR/Cas system-associated endoribonuclease Cas2
MNYLITYDLMNASPERYKELEDALKRLGAKHVEESVWSLIGSDHDGQYLARYMRIFSDASAGDHFIIARVDEWWTSDD